MLVKSRAVSWSFVQDFVRTNYQQLLKKTTEEVVSSIIIPETLNRKCEYASLLPSRNVSASPTYYVIHLHSALFLETFESIKKVLCSEDPATTFLWIDIFAINQHNSFQIDLEETDTAIQSATVGSLLCCDRSGYWFVE